MKHLTPSSLLNKLNHRLNKAEAEGLKASHALLKGDIPQATRRLKRSIALRGWAKRYSKALDAHCFEEFPQI